MTKAMGRESALIAMSGGVDSSVAAMLSLNDGIDCEGAMMRLYSGKNDPAGFSDSENDARNTAERLGIRFHIFDLRECFAEEVIDRFVKAYFEGTTPNPCIECNKRLKFGRFLEKALELSKSFIVTGHYARVERGSDDRYLLKKGIDTSKDQSYALYTLKQNQLARSRFPLGELTKTKVRELALQAGLQHTIKKESQDICFVPDNDYAGVIVKYSGVQPRKGRFIDPEGRVLGENKGIIHYTIGQRRGLGLAMPYPAYVLEIRAEDDSVVIGRNEQLYSKTLMARDINFIPFEKLGASIRASAKIRYNQREQPAWIHQTAEDTICVEFDEPQRAITKGQAVVIYDGDIVVGGGTIYDVGENI